MVSPRSAELGRTDCGPSSDNAGCYFIDERQGTYGPKLNEEGGAVLVMQWEEAGIRICAYIILFTHLCRFLRCFLVGNFPRGCVPLDLALDHPDPDFWPEEFLKGAWEGTTCPMGTHFKDMSIVFDITLCGDWAGKLTDMMLSYLTSWAQINAIGSVYPQSGCPGNCTAQVMTGSNFVSKCSVLPKRCFDPHLLCRRC